MCDVRFRLLSQENGSDSPTLASAVRFVHTKSQAMIEYHDATIRVRYAETDQMGVVYHSNYLIWFEVGRVELMRALGFDYKLMEIQDDTFIVVATCTAATIIRRGTTIF